MCETPSWRSKLRPLPFTLHKHLYLWSDHHTKGAQWYLMIQFQFSICCFILFLISFLWPVIWMAAFKGLVRHFNLFSINWSLGCVNVCIVNLDFIYLHRFDVVQFTCGVLIKANLFLFLFFNHSVLFPLLFSCF